MARLEIQQRHYNVPQSVLMQRRKDVRTACACSDCDGDRCVRGISTVVVGVRQRLIEELVGCKKRYWERATACIFSSAGTEGQGVLAADGGTQSLSMQVRGCAY